MGPNNVGNLPRQTPLTETLPIQNEKAQGANKAFALKIIYGDEIKGVRLNTALNNLKNLQAGVQNHIANFFPGNAE